MSSYNEGVEKVEDLVWTEIDTKEHYRRAFDYVYPKLLKIENE
jgi:choline kinase